jgi:hypothetical protein
MRRARVSARVVVRSGIIAVRSPQRSSVPVVARTEAAGRHRFGNSSALPGVVT